MLSKLSKFLDKKNELLVILQEILDSVIEKVQVIIPDLEYHILEEDGFTVVLWSESRKHPSNEVKNTTLSAVLADVFRSFPLLEWEFDNYKVYVSYEEAHMLYDLLTR